MAAVSLLNVEVLKKVAEVTAPLELEITFECLESLQKGIWDFMNHGSTLVTYALQYVLYFPLYVMNYH